MGKRNKYVKLYAVAGALLLIIILAYSNHFDNGFYFDDQHTIVDNDYITDIENIPSFFTEIASFGTMANNRGYRPIVTSLNAIDYWLAGGLNPVYFHVSIFISFIVLLVLIYYLYTTVFDNVDASKINRFVALLAVGIYGVHAANAETINYIISRSDSFSTLLIVASLVLYTTKIGKKYYLYLITLAIGIGTKEVAAMFAPLLFFYILLFEEKVSLVELVSLRKFKKTISAFKKSLPAFVVAFGLFYLTRNNFFIEDDATRLLATEANQNAFTLTDRWHYFYSQWVVIAHYIGNFILPLDLSADPDLTYAKSILDRKVLLSLLLILGLVTIAFWASIKKANRPISYGILWFFVTLAPTSTFHPFSQFANYLRHSELFHLQ